MMAMKRNRSERLLAILLKNVRAYRENKISYRHFFLRAQRLWLSIQTMPEHKAVDAAYLAAMEGC